MSTANQNSSGSPELEFTSSDKIKELEKIKLNLKYQAFNSAPLISIIVSFTALTVSVFGANPTIVYVVLAGTAILGGWELLHKKLCIPEEIDSEIEKTRSQTEGNKVNKKISKKKLIAYSIGGSIFSTSIGIALLENGCPLVCSICGVLFVVILIGVGIYFTEKGED